MLELEQDILEELERDRLGFRDPIALHRIAGSGQLGGGADGVVRARGDVHEVRILRAAEERPGRALRALPTLRPCSPARSVARRSPIAIGPAAAAGHTWWPIARRRRSAG